MDADAERIENAQGKAKDTTAKEVLTIMKFRYRCCNTTKVGEGKKLHPCMHSIARRCSSFFLSFSWRARVTQLDREGEEDILCLTYTLP